MKYAVMALFLFGCTLVGPLIVLTISGPRAAWEAWKVYAAFFGGALVFGAAVAGLVLI